MPSKTPSIALGVAAFVVLNLGGTFLALAGGTGVQSLGGCLGCLVYAVGPMLAVWHYASTHRTTLLPGQGAGVGAISGAVGAALAEVVRQGLVALDRLPDTAEMLAMQREQMLSKGMDPAQIENALGFAEKLGTATSNPLVSLALGLALGGAVGALVGALASVMFKKGGPATGAAL